MRRFTKKFLAVLTASIVIWGGMLTLPASAAERLTPDVSVTPGNTEGKGKDITDQVLNKLQGDSQTIVARFTSDYGKSVQGIVGLSDSRTGQANTYVTIFARNTGEIGAEIRDSGQKINHLLSRPALGRSKNASGPTYTTVALVGDAVSQEYSLYVDGRKVASKHVEEFLPLRGLGTLNKVTAGGVNRNGAVAWPLTGSIERLDFFNKALGNDEAKQVTKEPDAIETIFHSGDATGSNYFRIPGLLTLKSGRVLAVADARYGGTHDFLNKINTVISHSDDGGKTWSSPRFVAAFDDFANSPLEWPREPGKRDSQISGGATYIDSTMVQDTSTGRVIMLVDVMAAGVSFRDAKRGVSGFVQNGEEFYLQLKRKGESTYNYTVRNNGVIYDQRTDQPTNYSIGDNFVILQDGKPLQVEQYAADLSEGTVSEYHNGTMVDSTIFYKDAEFTVLPTNYIAKLTSEDGGETWSSPQLLPPVMGLNRNAPYLGPGRGVQLSNGDIVFTSYTGKEVVFLKSSDGGETFRSVVQTLPGSWSAEAHVVELSPGNLQSYMRTNNGKIGIYTSDDNGETWNGPTYLPGVKNPSYGTQLSAITVQAANGAKHVLLSTPNSTAGRRHGQILVGDIDSTGNSVTWKGAYDIDAPGIGFSYSCLTQLPNGNIGIYYEKFDSWSRNELHLKDVMAYEEIPLFTILNSRS